MDTTLLERFAERHRLRVQRVCNDGHKIRTKSDPFIPGSYGQLYAWDETQMCAMIFGPRATVGVWRNRLRAGVAVGMEVLQHGDGEGTLRFDPTNEMQVKVALKIVRCFRHTELSPARRAVLAKQLVTAREQKIA